MIPVVSSLVSVFLVLAVGWGLKASRLVDAAAWAGFERVTYFVFFPAVVVHTLAMTDLARLPFGSIGMALVGAIFAIMALLLILRPALERRGIDGPSFTSIFQGALRWNSFVALAVAANLHGAYGVALIAVAIAAMVPLLNLLSVAMLTRYAYGGRLGPSETLRAIAANPFLWSSLLGLLLNPVSAHLPKTLVVSVDILARAAVASGLLVVGAGLELKRLARPGPAHGIAILLKLVILPATAWALARLFGLEGAPLQLVVVASSVPTAAASYILARQMGGNAPLMAEITTLQTILALLSMPIMLYLLN